MNLIRTHLPSSLRALVIWTLMLSASAVASERIAITNVNVIPMDGRGLLEDQSVIVETGKIISVSETPDFESVSQVVDGQDGFLLPGLSDMHGHIYVDDPASPGSLPEALFLLYAASGVTLVRDPSGSDAHFIMRDRLNSGEWVGPELVFTATLIEGEQAVWPFSIKVLDPVEVDPLFQEFKEKGYWGVKIYHTVSAEVYWAALAAAEKYGLYVAGHVAFEVGIEDTLQSSQHSIEHLRGYDFDGMTAEELFATGGRDAKRFGTWVRMSDERMQELVDLTLESGVWNVPTLVINQFLYETKKRAALLDDPRITRVPEGIRATIRDAGRLDEIFPPDSREAMREALPRQMEFIRRLHERGGNLLIGTDSVLPAYVPGFTVHDEMKLMVEAGVSAYDTLKMATVHAARSVQAEHRMGQVAVGMDANLILLAENPIEDISALDSLHAVMIRGQWFEIEALEARLDDLAFAAEEDPD